MVTRREIDLSDERPAIAATMLGVTTPCVTQGIASLGGSAGTTIATAAMRKLPVGFPKLMVSTLASGDVKPYVGTRESGIPAAGGGTLPDPVEHKSKQWNSSFKTAHFMACSILRPLNSRTNLWEVF
jgi:hypothetical protein